MRQVITGAHTAEKIEDRNTQTLCKYRHTTHREDIVHSYRPQERTFPAILAPVTI